MTSTDRSAFSQQQHEPVDVVPLGLRDYVQIVNSVLFLILGVVILVRASAQRVSLLALVIGGGFVAFGLYRLKYIGGYFRRRKTVRGRASG